MRMTVILSSLLVSSFLFVNHAAASSSDTLRSDLAALKQTAPGSVQERALQKKIIGLVRKMKNKPVYGEFPISHQIAA